MVEAENKLLPWRVQTLEFLWLEFLWQDSMTVYRSGKGGLKQEVQVAQMCG